MSFYQPFHILLDTHSFIWFVNAEKRYFSPYALQQINKALYENKVFIAAATLWEVAMLVSKNRLALNDTTTNWLNKAVGMPGLDVAMPTIDVSVISTQGLPDLDSFNLNDPVDKLIMATAMVYNATLWTIDRKILSYAKSPQCPPTLICQAINRES